MPRPTPTKLLPPGAVLLAIVAMGLLDYLAPLARMDSPTLRVLGGLAIGLSLAVNIGCALAFQTRGTTVVPFRESSKLITGGLFAYSRNPIYLSMVVLLLGVATVLGSLSPLVVIPLFVVWITRRVIHVEEAMLEATFGEAYRAYRRRVRRWV